MGKNGIEYILFIMTIPIFYFLFLGIIFLPNIFYILICWIVRGDIILWYGYYDWMGRISLILSLFYTLWVIFDYNGE